MNAYRTTSLFATAALLVTACAAEEEAAPPNIAVDVEFPSVAAAVAVDSVKLFVFEGAVACNDLVRRRQTDQALPATKVETPSLSPCDFQRGTNNAFELPLRGSYTMLAVGQSAGTDLLVGCAQQASFGATRAQPIALTYVDATKRIPETTCAKLSDKCNGACQ